MLDGRKTNDGTTCEYARTMNDGVNIRSVYGIGCSTELAVIVLDKALQH